MNNQNNRIGKMGRIASFSRLLWTAEIKKQSNKNRPRIFAGLAFILALILLWPALPAAALSWTTQSSGTTNFLFGVTYGGGKFVAVGVFGTILTSPDGVTWTAQTATGNFYGVTYSGSQFVAVGGSGKIVTSPDGTTWTAQTSNTSNGLNGVIYGGGKFVAVGFSGTIVTSPDGTTWTVQTSNTSNGLNGVTYGGSQFVAVGYFGTIVTSPDGTTWTVQTSNTSNGLNGVIYGGGKFVAVGGSGTIVTSPDGTTWTALTSGTNSFYGITYGGSQFVAVGGSGTIVTSPDGATWTAEASGTTNLLYGVVYGGSQFVAVGSIGTIVTGGASTGPTAPTGLGATAASATQIDLAWTDTSSDEDGFIVERSLTGTGGWAAITGSPTAINAQTKSDTGLTCNTTYYYQVRATNGSGDSANITANATTSACVIPPNSVNTSTGSGTATFVTNNGTLGSLLAKSLANAATACSGSLPTGYTFPHGFFDFQITGVGAGGSANVTINLPSALPSNAKYFMCKGGTWITVPMNISGNAITVYFQDGVYDSDAVGGQISDPGGPGVPASAVGGVAERISLTPMQAGQVWFKEWGLVALSGLMLLGGAVLWRVRK